MVTGFSINSRKLFFLEESSDIAEIVKIFRISLIRESGALFLLRLVEFVPCLGKTFSLPGENFFPHLAASVT